MFVIILWEHTTVLCLAPNLIAPTLIGSRFCSLPSRPRTERLWLNQIRQISKRSNFLHQNIIRPVHARTHSSHRATTAAAVSAFASTSFAGATMSAATLWPLQRLPCQLEQTTNQRQTVAVSTVVSINASTLEQLQQMSMTTIHRVWVVMSWLPFINKN